jgi:integrase
MPLLKWMYFQNGGIVALTDTEIKKAKARGEAYSMADGGLYLWVTPPGGKLWRWSYRFSGKRKLMTLGRYPDISLADARDRHGDARKRLAKGVDPMAQRKAEKTAEKIAVETSFQSVAAKWLEYWRHGKSQRHAAYVERRMEVDVFPRLGARPIEQIEAPEVVAMVMAIQKRGAEDIAKRALQTTAQVFCYGIALGYWKRNPASEFRPADVLRSTRVTNYARVDAKEVPDLLRSIEVYQGTHVTRLAMKLMSLTFLRTSELIGVEWAESDFEGARWDIPAERMKMRKPHIVPLARQTLEVLEMLRRWWLTQLIAPGTSLGGARPKASVRDETGALCVAKFPSRRDTRDVGAWELVANSLARKAGINVPEAWALHFQESEFTTFLVKRSPQTSGSPW